MNLAERIASLGVEDGLNVKYRAGQIEAVHAPNPPVPGLVDVTVAGVTVAGVPYMDTGVTLVEGDQVLLLLIGPGALVCLGRFAL
ncbi:MAG: hypothetical protein AB7L84_16260 [Acidimicrobiia bacterium]